MDTTTEPNLGHELLGDIKALAEEATAVLGNMARGNPNGEAIATLRAQFEVIQARFAEMYGEAKRMTVERAKQADQAVRENPYTSIAIVAGLGVVAGILIGRATKSD